MRATRSPRPSFLLLGLAGIVLHGGAAIATGYATLQVVPCHLAALGEPPSGACGRMHWPFEAYPWIAVGLLLALTFGWFATAVTSTAGQLRATRRHVRKLVALADEPDPRLRRSADRMGLGSVAEVPAPQPLAFTHGLARPEAVISSGLVDRLSDRELDAVVAHEASHVRRRDPLRLLVLRTLARAAFAFPVLRDLADHSQVDCELTADREAVRKVSRRATASALREVLSCPLMTFREEAVASIDGFAERVSHLADDRPPPLRVDARRVAATVAAAVVLVAVTVPAVQAAQAATPTFVTHEGR